jgi:filamentous hemagglutinin family protein
VVKDATWEEEHPGVGMVHHAFPQVSFKEPSFKRDLEDRNFLTGVTDGDQATWHGTLAGMGEGLALQNRSGVLQGNGSCSFHKGESTKQMFTGFLRDAKLLRSQNQPQWDRAHGMGHLLPRPAECVFQAECGGLLDGRMQHDCRPVALCLWAHLRAKTAPVGVPKANFDRLGKYHHPVSGIQGHHGRASQTHELALHANAVRSVIDAQVKGVLCG